MADRATFHGIPELWRIVLDRLARDPAICDSKTALRMHLLELLPETDDYERARIACLALQDESVHSTVAMEGPLAEFVSKNEIARVFRHSAV